MTDVETTTVASGFKFLEAPRWHEDRIWFSDFYTHQVFSAREDGSDLRTEADVAAAAGRARAGCLTAACWWCRCGTARSCAASPTARWSTHADLSGHATGHANDMVLDGAGRAYVGNFGFDLMSGAPLETASLYRVDPDGTVTEAADDLWFPNGSVITPDGVLIVNETFGNRCTAFDLTEDGRLANRRVWAEFGPLPTERAMDAVSARSRSRPTAAASTPRGRCGSPTRPEAGCSGSGRAARSLTSCTPAPRCSRARSAAPTAGRCTPAPPPTSSSRPGWPPTRRRSSRSG